MDAAGVGRQVLSPHRPPYLPDEAECVTRGQAAQRRLCRVGAPLPRPHLVLRDAAVAAYRRGAEGDGARLRPARLRRRQHEHHLPRPLDRRDRVRADLRRDEPARRDPVRASVGPAASARPSSTTTNSPRAVGTSLEDASFVLHMIAKQIPYRYPNIKFIVPHLGGPIPMLLNRLDKQGQSPRGHPEPRRGAERHRQEILLRHGVLRLEGGVLLRPRSVRRRPSRDRQRLSGVAGLREPTRRPSPISSGSACRKPITDKILHHNAQKLFGFDH